MHTTTNYQLCQWEGTDRILMENFNGDNQKVDAALKANADAAASAAAAAAARGNCQIWADTYTGNGKAGSNNPCSVAFPQKPVLFRISQADNSYYVVSFHGCQELYVMNGASVYVCTASWSGNTLSWYHADSYVRQMNDPNKLYHVVALFAVMQRTKRKGKNPPGQCPGGFFCLTALTALHQAWGAGTKVLAVSPLATTLLELFLTTISAT